MGNPSDRASVVIGIDIGSTNVKVAALTETGFVVARTCLPTPRNGDDQTIDASALFDTIETMIIDACSDRFAIQAVAAAGIGEDGILVDDAHIPLVPAMAWFDPRRTDIFSRLKSKLPVAERTGVVTEPSRTLTGWAWAREQDGAEKAAAWIAVTDYAACRWAHTNFISDTLASRTAAFDVEHREWIPERVKVSLGSLGLLPAVHRAGDVVGPLRSARLQEAGLLRSDAVVVVGGHDHPVGGWGVHQMHPGSILDSMGTAEVVVAQSPDHRVVGRGQLDISPGIRSDGTTLLRVEELSRNVYWASEDKAVGEALRQITAGAVEPDSYFESHCFVPGAQGGIAPHFTWDAPTKAISRASAVVGSLARLGSGAVQAVADQMPANAAIYVAGGWARAKGWLDAKRAISSNGFRVVAEPEVTAVGAALLAAAGIGWKVSAEQALTPCELPVGAASEKRVKRFWTGDAE
jgi:sugar (pentulose or hexulose) kinase